MVINIFERALTHFVMSAGVLLIALIVLFWASRHSRLFGQLRGWWWYIVPAFLSFALISLREVFDVYYGQALVKAGTDWLSWIAGLTVSVWGLYRATPGLYLTFKQIKTGSDRLKEL